MNQFWEKVEEKNTKLIPLAIVLLALIILYELFFHTENPAVNHLVEILDGIVVAIFVVDLIFLAIRAQSTRYFFQHYWLDILAVLPLGLIFRGVGFLMEGFTATRQVALGQELVHGGLEARKEIALVTRSEHLAEAATKAGRTVRVYVRIARVVSKTHLFQKFITKDYLAKVNWERGLTTRKPKRHWKRANTSSNAHL